MTSPDLSPDVPDVPAAPAVRDPRAVVAARVLAGLAAIAGLVASGALVAPYVVKKGLCTPGGGCDQVAHSAYAELLGVPRAFIGVVAFSIALALVVIGGGHRSRARRLAPVVGVLAAIEGLHLLALQLFVLKAI